jgi:hypothetical protein
VRRDHEGAERRHHQRVAIGRRALHLPAPMVPVAPALLSTMKFWTQLFLQLGREHARQAVGGAAGGKARRS